MPDAAPPPRIGKYAAGLKNPRPTAKPVLAKPKPTKAKPGRGMINR